MNSFKNSKYKNKRKGFSMVEMLAVVAIIAILTGLSAVGINKYRRSLKLVEMDGLAKEIYVAAQNNLTMAYGQSYLGISSFGTKDDTEAVKDKEVYYYIVDSSYQFKQSNAAENALDLMLPSGAIDSTVLSEGNFIIRYQRSTGTVLDVFYSSASGYSFSHTFTANDYSGLIYGTADKDYKTESELRKNYGDSKAVIGYCGNYAGPIESVDSSVNLSAPTVRGVNSDILYAVVTFPDNPDSSKYNDAKIITVTGEDGKTVTFEIGDDGVVKKTTYDKNGNKVSESSFNISDTNSQLRKVTEDGGRSMPGDVTVPKGSYILILDDITTKNLHFTDLYPTFTPGENLVVQSEVKLSEKGSTTVSHSATSNKVTLNSLFGTKVDDEVTINNIRQLENLDPDISGFNPGKKIKVEQNSNIDFNDFVKDLKKGTEDPEITRKGGKDDPSDKGTFAPLDINYPIEYDGNDHSIENIVVKTEGPAGIFGSITGTGSVIKDLAIINPNIWSDDNNAGALVGTVTGGSSNKTKISGVVAYNARPVGADSTWSDTSLKVHAGWSAGGLIGCGSNVDVDACAAALYVEAYPKNKDADFMYKDANGNYMYDDKGKKKTSDETTANAGGFIGRANNSTITGCYSGGHTVSGKYLSSFIGKGRVNVVGSYYSGGFAAILNSTDVDCCYTTCSAGSDTSSISTGESSRVAGFAPKISHKSSVDYCYSVGRIVGSDVNKTCEFVYTNTVVNANETQSGSNNYYLSDVSSNVNTNSNVCKIYGVSSFSIESNNSNVISYVSSRKEATTYDDVLLVDYEGKYYFLTVDQLYEKANLTNAISKDGITNVQYGDWQVPSSSKSSSVFFKNGNTLELRIELESLLNNSNKITVGIEGSTSGEMRVFLFNILDKNKNAIAYTAGYVNDKGDIVWTGTSGQTKIPAEIDSSGKYLIITLDDITTKDRHFCQLLGTKVGNLPALIPGENITAYVLSGLAAGEAELKASSSDITNSLFDYGTNRLSGITKVSGTQTNVMYISNVRHLQNLSSAVSGLVTSRPGNAYLSNDITWDAPFSSGIYSENGGAKYSGFRGIEYDNLQLFDGKNHTLENFNFANICISTSGSIRYASGLFLSFAGGATTTKDVTIKNLIILNPTASSDSSKITSTDIALFSEASALIAKISGKINLTINTVAIIDNSTENGMPRYAISAYGLTNNSSKYSVKFAGGLIGYVDTSSDSTVTINNSSVSANVQAYSEISQDSSAAGGFIGRANQGKITIKNSYVGGHTYQGAYYSDVFNVWNISGYRAGSFIGYALNNSNQEDRIIISNTFTTASVRGNVAGSFVGSLARKLSLENVYTTAPVYGVTDATANVTAGALIGEIKDSGSVGFTSSHVYYLPENYDLKTLTDSQLVASGSNKIESGNSAQPVYYDTTSGKISTTDVQKEVTIKKGNTIVVAHPFDQTLISASKEYPFISWTTSPDPDEGNLRSYTGDWVVEGIEQATTHTATFYYIKGNTEGILTTPSNNSKNFMSGGNAEVIVPAMDSANPGYNATAWYVGSKIDISKTFDFTTWRNTATEITSKYDSATGKITIPSKYTGADCSIIVIYTAAANTYTVDFRYDVNGTNNYAQSNSSNIRQLDTPQIVKKLSETVVPTCTVSGKTFIGWYSDPELTTQIDFSNTDALTASVTAYAKFAKSYTITVNYRVKDSNGNLSELLSAQTKTYLSEDGSTSTVTLLEGATDIFLDAYKLVGFKVGSDISTATSININNLTASGKTYTYKPASAEDAVYYAIYEQTNASINLDYTVKFIFTHTEQDSWAYSSSATKTITYPTSDHYHADNAAALMIVEGKSFSEFFNEQTIDSKTKWSDGFVITGYSLPSVSDPVLRINVERRKFTVSADANTGAYIEPVEVEYGKILYSEIGTATLTRKGYTFPTNFEDRWKYYKLGDSSSSAEKVTTTTTMPAYDVVLYANWIAGTSNYTVLFWFENANDTDYAYGGSLTQQGKTGDQVSTDTWNTLSGLTSSGTTHVHSVSCFAGATSKAFTTEYEGGEGLCEDSTKYWVANGKRLSTSSNPNPDKVSGAADGLVYEFTYESGGKVKGIKIGSSWYVYTGSAASGTIVSCTGNSTTWVTNDYKNYFTYSKDVSYLKSSDGNGHETIDGDGTTVLNVYYSRNKYHFYVVNSYDNSTLVSGGWTHTHGNNCYTLTCGIEEHVHQASCLSCTKTEHVHGIGYCNYTCGKTVHVHDNVTCICGTEAHTHGASCYTTKTTSVLQCDHADGYHLITCLIRRSGSYTAESSMTDETTITMLSELKSVLRNTSNETTAEARRVYKVEYSQTNGCRNTKSTYYFLYTGNTWYELYDYTEVSLNVKGNRKHNDDYRSVTNVDFTEIKNQDNFKVSKSDSLIITSCSHGDNCSHNSECYKSTTVSTLTCKKTEHTHSSACCTIKSHEHTDSCCSIPAHIHSETEGCYNNCKNEKQHTHTNKCYSLTCKYGETNSSYALVIYAKYQQNISDEWETFIDSIKSKGYFWWNDDTYDRSKGKYNRYFGSNHYVYSLDIMPGQDLYFEVYSYGSSSATVNYYLEAPAGKTTSIKVNGKYFELYTTGYPKASMSFTYMEEFYDILGFTQYAYKVRDNSVGYITHYSNGSVKEDFSGYSIRGETNLYYTRDSFTLELWVDNVNTKTYSVQSDVVLDSYCDEVAAIRPSYVESDYVFGGWYYDQACTKPYVKGSTMPKSNYILYGKWNPPTKTVTFKLSEGDTSAYNTASTFKYSTLEGIVTDKATNEYLKEYKPNNLAYWYYLEGSTKKRFIPQKQITEDMTLYAEYANSTSTSTVTVKYKCGSDEIATSSTYTYTIGGVFGASPKTITGYSIVGWRDGETGELQANTSASIAVSKDATSNVIVFEYEVEKKWSYTVKYVALYKSQYTGTVSGVTFSSTDKEIEISSTTVPDLTKLQSQIVEFVKPTGYEKYTLDHISVDGSAIYGRSYEYMSYIDGKATRTITFYITPDKSECTVSDLHFTYDSTDKLKSINSSSIGTPPSYADGATVKYYYSLSEKEAIHAGSYRMNVYAVLTIGGSNYLLWKSEDGSVRLVIDPLTIHLKSGSSSQAYSSKSVLTNIDVTTENDLDWESAFCINSEGKSDADYFEPVFTIDAFRLDAGVSTNSFIMQIKSDTDETLAKKLAGDYLIETTFGTLTVEWKYEVVYKFRYRSTVDTDTTAATLFPISDTGTVVSTDSTKNIDVTMDSKYLNCRLCYSYAGSEYVLGNNSAYTYTVEISPEVSKDYNKDVSKLVVYIEPNVTLAEAYLPSKGETYTFNGEIRKLSTNGFNKDLFNAYKPTGVTTTELSIVTIYYNGAGEVIAQPTNADTYYTTTNIYLNVKTNVGSTSGTQYLLASDTSKAIKLTINPLAVTVKSPNSSAYIDVDGSLVFNSGANAVTTSSTLLKTSMFTVVNADNGSLEIGANTEGNYFTIKWNSGVNSDNFKVTRVYGNLDLTWRVKISFYLRAENCNALTGDTFVNYSGLAFDRTGTAFLIKDSTGYIELSATKKRIATSDLTAMKMIPSSCSGYTVASNYSFNGASYSFGTDMSPNVNVFGERGANEVCIYLVPNESKFNDVITSATKFTADGPYNTLASVVFDGVTITERFVKTNIIYRDSEGNTFDANNLTSGTEYTRYAYAYLQITIINSSGVEKTYNYLLNYAYDTKPYTYNG